uniref:U6 small nuclear RNA (adenine-(43)-N(6))-methyltransferase n=1 Tax=Lynceus sp. MCZ IZ 141354 TaxID=1930659 RepID=A0A9N6ZFX0_9CRUS|nr:EOG090X04JL [Lynceus sp. MCZ IZ 141354]
MNLNKRMHPRNPYRRPPNFKELALAYPEFREYAKQDLTGKITLDFADPKAVRALTRTLLLKDFHLDIEIPDNRLIPTLPSRLNYLLWLEDLIQSIDAQPVYGIDIGTGASCIYSILASKNNWRMLATESDELNCQTAKDNVRRNGLQDSICVKKVRTGTLLKDNLDEGLTYHFCMCNPPFYDEASWETPKSRTPNRPLAKTVPLGGSKLPSEVSVEGGEINFVAKLIEESLELSNNVLIFTTKLGHKSSVHAVKNLFKKHGIFKFTTTEFCQGKTMRWGVAWTFQDFNLTETPATKPKPPLKHKISRTDWLSKHSEFSLSCIVSKIKDLLSVLKLKFRNVNTSKTLEKYEVIAQENTWSNLRRRRREEQRLARLSSSSSSISSPMAKKLKLEDDDDAGSDSSASEVLRFFLQVRVVESGAELELTFISGSAGRDGVHQILQFLKNSF